MIFSDLHYFSGALQKQTGAYVLLPDSGSGPFPVLYLLHGLSDDQTMWLRRTSIERYVEGMGLIVVMPDGGRGFYSNAPGGYQYLDAIGTELVGHVDRLFPTKPERDGRCLAGLSMGGYGALKIALSFPDRFASAVSHSGALAWAHRARNWDDKPFSVEMQRLMGDNPIGGPNDLHALAEKMVGSGNSPALRIDCGVDDFLIEANREFHQHLNTIGYEHQYEEYPGAHEWSYWDKHVQEALEFHRQVLKF